jgi:hypothetical protein
VSGDPETLPALTTPAVEVGSLKPQPHGGALRHGNPGNKGGRPSSVIREALRVDFSRRRRHLRTIADNKPVKNHDGTEGPRPYTVSDQLKALDLMAKYGMGMPVEVGGPDGSPFTVAVRAATVDD